MTTAVTLAGKRPAPYCSARLERKNSTAMPTSGSNQSGPASAGQAMKATLAMPVAAAPATTTPPRNMAKARAWAPRAASRRSITLFSAKVKPPSTPSMSAKLLGSGRPPLAGVSTIAAPARAKTMRRAASGVSRSPRISRASSTAHSGIR